jgi:hypothetical protein
MSADPQPPTSSPFQRLTANPALFLLAIVAVVALLAACILGFLLLRPRLLGSGQETDGVTTGEPTPFPQSTAPASSDQAVIVGISDTGTFTVTLDYGPHSPARPAASCSAGALASTACGTRLADEMRPGSSARSSTTSSACPTPKPIGRC